jgi:hypothetical protein
MLARGQKWVSCATVAASAASSLLTAAATCVGDKPSVYSDDAQAGGHVDGVRFMGSMLHKRLQNEGRGDREVAALAALAQSPRWRDYVPRYGGVHTDVSAAGGSEPWLVMENLAAGMVQPAVMDIKIGTRHFSSDSPSQKIAKEKKKARTTTIGTHGLRSMPLCHGISRLCPLDAPLTWCVWCCSRWMPDSQHAAAKHGWQ